MLLSRAVLVGGLCVLTGCPTPSQRRAEEAAQARKDVVQEIARICALPAGEREAELEKLQKNEGMVLFCGSDRQSEHK
jgi:hypothetical protein